MIVPETFSMSSFKELSPFQLGLIIGTWVLHSQNPVTKVSNYIDQTCTLKWAFGSGNWEPHHDSYLQAWIHVPRSVLQLFTIGLRAWTVIQLTDPDSCFFVDNPDKLFPSIVVIMVMIRITLAGDIVRIISNFIFISSYYWKSYLMWNPLDKRRKRLHLFWWKCLK